MPALAAALSRQAQRMAHMMFGGFMQEPAVAIEVAQKMALQYWQAERERSAGHACALLCSRAWMLVLSVAVLASEDGAGGTSTAQAE